MSRYNQGVQNVEDVKGFVLKHLEVGKEYFCQMKSKVILEDIQIIKDVLFNCRKFIPDISLI